MHYGTVSWKAKLPRLPVECQQELENMIYLGVRKFLPVVDILNHSILIYGKSKLKKLASSSKCSRVFLLSGQMTPTPQAETWCFLQIFKLDLDNCQCLLCTYSYDQSHKLKRYCQYRKIPSRQSGDSKLSQLACQQTCHCCQQPNCLTLRSLHPLN